MCFPPGVCTDTAALGPLVPAPSHTLFSNGPLEAAGWRELPPACRWRGRGPQGLQGCVVGWRTCPRAGLLNTAPHFWASPPGCLGARTPRGLPVPMAFIRALAPLWPWAARKGPPAAQGGVGGLCAQLWGPQHEHSGQASAGPGSSSSPCQLSLFPSGAEWAVWGEVMYAWGQPYSFAQTGQWAQGAQC